MRLLNVKTFEFEEFIGKVGNGIPLYAILSHTWDIEEVSFEDYVGQQCKSKKGYNKIYNCCRVAESEGFQYVWIDTCCIDKSSSAELSEAINSMFQWYREAALCYVYLSDVDSSEDPTTGRSSFFRSRWFTRGWTLQELLAPAEVVFLSSDWVEIGSKKSLLSTVSRIAGIDEKALDEYRGTEYSVAQKMSWAAARQTTRIEDEAYCLMGLFEINMPLLYGEGDKAFSRLQQEILKQSEDQSIFAWSYPEEYHSHTSMTGLLAPSPKCFKDISRVELLEYKHGEEYDNAFEVVGRRIRIRSRILDQVKAINLGKLNRDSILRVIEVQQSGERREVESLASSTASNLEIDVTPNIEEAIISMPIPVIVIEGEDKALDSSSGSLSESVLQEDAFQKEITDRSSVESTTQVLCTNRIEHFASENTYWYI
ncbi:heterokaryon incompatibility protein-domain-containing protein [Xylogone sp. PMI_703]|nr:heterokaryon incompatibility protein-domain-containing protein [Xylogone sp. PMI_703]